MLAPFVEFGVAAGAGEVEDVALGIGGALAKLPESALFIEGAIIGGLGIEVPVIRVCPKLGLVTSGLDISGPVVLRAG